MFPLTQLPDHLENAQIANMEKGYHLWGSSPVVGEDGKVHLFTARWPAIRGLPTNGFSRYWQIDGHIRTTR